MERSCEAIFHEARNLSGEARDAVRHKVEALFPAHEVDEFTELFFSRIQRWRERDADRRSQPGDRPVRRLLP